MLKLTNAFVIPANAGIQKGPTGFRVKPGMTAGYIDRIQVDQLPVSAKG